MCILINNEWLCFESCINMDHLHTWQFWLFSWRGEVASSGKMLTFLLFKICSSFFALRSSTLTSTLRRLSSCIKAFNICMNWTGAYLKENKRYQPFLLYHFEKLLTFASFPLFLNWVSRALFSLAADILMRFA